MPEIQGCNLAFEVQPFYYCLRLLKRFASNVYPGGTVLIGICPFSFCLLDFSASMRKSYRNKRYAFLFGVGFFSSISQKISFCFDKFYYFLMKILFRILQQQSPDTIDDLPEENDIPVDFTADAEKWMTAWRKSFFVPADYKELKPLNETIQCNIGYVKEMAELALKNGLRPAFVLAPVWKELYERFPTEQQMEYCLYEPIKHILKEIPSVLFFDHLKDPEFQKREYFCNTLLLNKKGRYKFTAKLLSKLDTGDNNRC